MARRAQAPLHEAWLEGLLSFVRHHQASQARRAGNKARNRQDWPAAREAYDKVLRLTPDNAAIWVQYGHAQKESGDPHAAEQAYRRALALEGGRADTHHQLGHALKLLGRLDEAHEAYGEAARLAPDWPEPRREQMALLPARQSLAVVVANSLEHLLEEAQRCEAAGQDNAAMDAYAAVLRKAAAHPVAWPHYRALKQRRHAQTRARLIAEQGERYRDLPDALRFVAFGTIGLCNASCIHCPTGKDSTAHVPRVPMPMALFRRIVQQMAELDHVVETQISLGLFGDGLVDPYVVERVRFLRETLPDARISVNTNGAAYARDKHRVLADMTSVLALHVESLVPETYNRLMAPLRLDRVMPKIRQIMEDFPGRVHVSTPVSRLNRQELPDIYAQFVAWGAIEVGFDGLSSRCAEDQTVFRQLALHPVPIRCTPDVRRDLIVDCDGTVMICCQDFQRIESIGNLAQHSLMDVLIATQRHLVAEQFATDRHCERATCQRCYGDVRLTPQQIAAAAA